MLISTATNGRIINDSRSKSINYLPTDSTIQGDTIIAPKLKQSFLDDKVMYSASDSIILDLANEKAFLYNNAKVEYEDMTLTAGYIELNFGENLVFASGFEDSTGLVTQKPVSNQNGEEFKAGEIRYNFETKKGKIKNVITQQGEGYIHGNNIKRDSNNTYYVSKGRYTTCDLEHPHFFIGANKIKVIPDDKIITGPAYLNVADVPTPLAIPFGYFPNKKGRASGILIPTYGESPNWGFFLKDGGFYFGNSEYFDLALRGDIYTNGSFSTKALSYYKKRYKFGGSFNIGYSKIIDGDPEFFNSSERNDFFVRWTHNQDAKANPGSRFSANVNAGSSTYNTFNGDVNNDYLSNTFQSNISYAKSIKLFNIPSNFSANARHSQNTITKQVDLSLPELALTMNRFYLFKDKDIFGKGGVGVSLSANAKNNISSPDSLLFTQQTLEKMQNGITVNMPMSLSYKILKYFTLTPAANISGKMYFETITKSYDSDLNTIIKDTVKGVKTAADYNFSTRLNTLMYGNYYFKSKRLKQIRHVLTPAISASYKPDFSKDKYGYYDQVQSDSLGNIQTYSIFENGVYGGPSAGESGLIGMSLNNTLEAKTINQSDTGKVTKKIKLIDNLNIATSYNVAANSYNWSNINISGRTQLFKKLNIYSRLDLDPYQIDSSGTGRVERFEWENNRIGRLVSSSTAVSIGFRSKKTNNKSSDNSNKEITNQGLEYIQANPNAYIDFNIPWSLNISYNLNYSKPYLEKTISQAASFSGDLSLTPKWKIAVNSGFDFNTNKLSLTSVNIYRDLHCWELSFNWVPFGLRQSFSLNLNVKSSTLRDLKLTRKRNWQDFQ